MESGLLAKPIDAHRALLYQCFFVYSFFFSFLLNGFDAFAVQSDTRATRKVSSLSMCAMMCRTGCLRACCAVVRVAGGDSDDDEQAMEHGCVPAVQYNRFPQYPGGGQFRLLIFSDCLLVMAACLVRAGSLQTRERG